MKNPVQEAWESLGLSRAEMARKAGLTYTAVAYTARGYARRPSPAILRVLEREGFDPEELTKRYEEWRSLQEGDERGAEG